MTSASALAPSVLGRPRVICCHMATLSGTLEPNSLAAVEECVAAGAPRLEIDVRFSADDVPVVFHDADLDRRTTGQGAVDALAAGDIRRLRYRPSGEPLATLAQVVGVLGASSTVLQVDLKLAAPLRAARVQALAALLAPLGPRALLGSEGHWNLRPFAGAGIRLAFDPTHHWHYAPARATPARPATLGRFGLWDDAPLAHLADVAAQDYVRGRVEDIAALAPWAVEWMVDIATVRYLGQLGLELGNELSGRGIELAAWTVRSDDGPGTEAVLRDLFRLGTTTVITDVPRAVAEHCARIG